MSDASDEKRKPPESVRLDIMFGSKGETWCASTGSMGINDGDIEDVEYVRADLVDPSDVPSDEWLNEAEQLIRAYAYAYHIEERNKLLDDPPVGNRCGPEWHEVEAHLRRLIKE
jgi:hypothetical protein